MKASVEGQLQYSQRHRLASSFPSAMSETLAFTPPMSSSSTRNGHLQRTAHSDDNPIQAHRSNYETFAAKQISMSSPPANSGFGKSSSIISSTNISTVQQSRRFPLNHGRKTSASAVQKISSSYIEQLSPWNQISSSPRLASGPNISSNFVSSTTSASPMNSSGFAHSKAFQSMMRIENLSHQLGGSDQITSPRQPSLPGSTSFYVQPLNIGPYIQGASAPSFHASGSTSLPASIAPAEDLSRSGSLLRKINAYAAVRGHAISNERSAQNHYNHTASLSRQRELSPQRSLSLEHQSEHSYLNTVPHHARSDVVASLDSLHPSLPVSADNHSHIHASNSNMLLDEEIASLASANAEYTRMRSKVEAKLQGSVKALSSSGLPNILTSGNDTFSDANSPGAGPVPVGSIPFSWTQRETPTMQVSGLTDNDSSSDDDLEPRDPDLDRKQDFMNIVDFITSMRSSEQLDGLLMLSVFLEENKDSINWDGLMLLFLKILNFIPEPQVNERHTGYGLPDAILIFDMACFCISQMCNNSPPILDRARSLNAIPRMINLLKYEDAALRNTVCRALMLLTDSNADLKLLFINHEVTNAVLLQKLSSFDDELKVVVMTLLARSVYGCMPHIKEKFLTFNLLQEIAVCIMRLPTQAVLGRAACILLCNALAGSSANIEKATQFGMFKHLTTATLTENGSIALSYLLSAMMNFRPTASHLTSLSDAGIPMKLPEFLSRSDPGLSQNSLQMLGWIKSAD